jgi:putative transcriptional regulator
LRIAPGSALPYHGHSGAEMNVILEGGYNDGAIRFEAGDFTANDVGVRHKPTADPDDYCVALVGLGGPLEFGGASVRLLQTRPGI